VSESPRATTGTRIGVLAGVFAAALGVVLVHLWLLMVRDQDVWARRSYENRWAFRSVPSLRGRLLDRHGAVLAYDEPTTRVSVHYLRFRLRNCIGAAVHGGTVCLRLEPGMEFQRYGYDRDNGPREAVRDLFSMPVRAIEPGVLPKDVTSQLATYATTVLSLVGDLSRRDAYRAMREGAQSGRRLGIGDVLDVPREQLLLRFDRRLQDLRDLSDKLYAQQVDYAERRGLQTEAIPTLLQKLDELCVASLNKEQVSWQDDQGVERKGSYVEELRTPLADEVSFDIAAVLRVEDRRYAGIAVAPSVRRVSTLAPKTAYDALVGRVNWLDRTVAERNRMRVLLTGQKPPTWVQTYMDEQMPASWARQLVPEGLVADETRLLMIEEARRRYERELMTRERRGVTGFEAWFNDALMGQLGMRFVEHDGNRREHALWSHLQVESGDDVRITIDSRLQAIAERAVEANWQLYRSRHDDPDKARRVEAAIAIIDALTGDVLACAGAPIETDNARHVPGVMWVGNGSIGSVAKPFILAEHLESLRLGRPHIAAKDIEMCSGRFVYQGHRLRCDGAHWGEGQHPRHALAKSCNCFFYQVGVGIGAEGVQRAYHRFGLLDPTETAPKWRPCWQGQVPGISVAHSNLDGDRILPSQAIGYGMQASPLIVARAYAALATGALPTLGLRAGEQRDRITPAISEQTMQLVRTGLQDVLVRGTGKELDLLQSLGARGKTGTAERSNDGDNNAWFAGYLPAPSAGGHQLAFCGVVYYVPDQTHGAGAAGEMLEGLFAEVARDAELKWRYLPR
jgi:cell division protein FtsI/penicillin-binding protein 2